MYDDVATLISYTTTGRDQYGNPVVTPAGNDVFVQPRGVYASEFYQAANAGIKPSITFFLANRWDYNGEKVVQYKDKLYSVIRVDWTAQRDGVSLVCEEKVNSGEPVPII